LANQVTRAADRPLGVTTSAIAYFVNAVGVLIGAIASALSPGTAPSQRVGILIFGGILAGVASLIGIGLMRRSKTAFFVAIALAILLILPVPQPNREQVPIYLIQAAVAITVVVLLLGNRGWFLQSRRSEPPPA
jgi:hypothetical protein